MVRKGIVLLCVVHLLSVCHLSDCEPSCSTFFEETGLGDNQKSLRFISEELWTKNEEITLLFSHIISDIQSPVFEAERRFPEEWTLSLAPNGTATKRDLSFNIFYSAKMVKVIQMKRNGFLLCQDVAPPHLHCYNKEVELHPNQLLQVTATWNAGLAVNYQVEIPACPDFVGYALEIIFTTPVSSIEVSTKDVIGTQLSPYHWALTKEWTEDAVFKLVKVFMTVTYVEKGEVQDLLLNGRSVFGAGSSLTRVVNRNRDISKALTKDCESFLKKRSTSWFSSNGEKARPLNFNATVGVRPQVGIVIDFIFKENIQELRMWDMRHERVEGNHWRLSNAGWTISEDGTVAFPLALYYFRHLYVPLVGVRINDEVLCGLGTSITYNLDEYVLPEMSMNSLDKTSFLIYGSVAAISLNVIVCTLVFGFILVKKIKESSRNRPHLCDFPPMETNACTASCSTTENPHADPQQTPNNIYNNPQWTSSNDYMTVNKGFLSDEADTSKL